MTEPRPRIGVRRPTTAHPVALAAEGRVLRTELERRLGPITLDLRIDADGPLGPWEPVAHAAWPADIDVAIDTDDLYGETIPPLTALFARTVEPVAAEVRRRMLAHLGLIRDRSFDDDTLAELDVMVVTPTDLWLLVDAAPSVDVSDPAIAGLAVSDAGAALDVAFDTVAARLSAHDLVARSTERALERATAEVAELRRRLAEVHDRLTDERHRHDVLIDDLGRRLAEQRRRADAPS